MILGGYIKWPGILIAIAYFCTTGISNLAAETKSTDYSLDYAITSTSGGNSVSGPYEVISRVTTTGFAVVASASSTYSMTPVGATSSDATSVADWVLY